MRRDEGACCGHGTSMPDARPDLTGRYRLARRNLLADRGSGKNLTGPLGLVSCAGSGKCGRRRSRLDRIVASGVGTPRPVGPLLEPGAAAVLGEPDDPQVAVLLAG